VRPELKSGVRELAAIVLVIEDDQIILENTLELLELEGFTAIGAPDGIVGVELAQARIPDVIICDILMPRLDGYGVLKEVRSNPTTATIPFIFVSATPREEVLAVSAQLGASDYLLKPFRANDLLRVVSKLLDSRALNEPD
jgi:two-component system, sensor histidine kinase and response regulator